MVTDCVDLVKKFKKLRTTNFSKDDLQKFDCCAGWHGNKDMFYMKDGSIIKKVY